MENTALSRRIPKADLLRRHTRAGLEQSDVNSPARVASRGKFAIETVGRRPTLGPYIRLRQQRQVGPNEIIPHRNMDVPWLGMSQSFANEIRPGIGTCPRRWAGGSLTVPRNAFVGMTLSLADGRRADMAETSYRNNGRSWSAMELDDLERGLRLGVSIQVIADFIMRDVDEVRRKALELGILPKRKQLVRGAFK
jgi:hypothetical protein